MTAPRPSLARAAALAAALVLTFAPRDVSAQDAANPLRICTSEWTPAVFCRDREVDAFSGFEIDLCRKALQIMGIPREAQKWTCRDVWDDMLSELATDDSECDVVCAGQNVDSAGLERGMTYSWTTLRNGLVVAVSLQKQTADYWSFLSAFSWQLWLAIVATSLGVGLVVWGLDRWSMPPPRERPPLPILYAAADFGDGAVRDVAAAAADLDRYLWEAISRPMGTRSMIAFTFSSNLVILSWSFAVLVLTILYTASTTSNMTANRLLSTIRGVSDLPGRTVGTVNTYVDTLKRYGISAIDFPWNNLEDEAAMFEALRSGRIAALVMDESFLRYTAASTCDLTVVGDAFNPFDQAVAFSRRANATGLVGRWNAALLKLREGGEVSALMSTWIMPPEASCKTVEGTGGADETVTMAQVAGLWLMLAASIAVALGCALASVLHRRFTKPALDAAASRVARAVSLKVSSSLQRAGSGQPRKPSDGFGG